MNADALIISGADILIVDDTPANLEMFSSILTASGCSVRVAHNGTMGLKSAREAPPDLILLDINMPDITGFEVCERLKADERTSDVPVIFISAMDQTEDIVKAFTLGGVDYITKPVQYEEMMARIATHLSLHKLQRQMESANEELQEINAQLKNEIKVRTQMQMQLLVLSRAVQQTASSVIITDTNGLIEYVNPSFLVLTGYSDYEVLGQTPSILKSGKTRRSTYDELWGALKRGKEWRGEFINRKKSGELFWELAVISPIRNTNGQITHYMAVKEDITARKKMEAELKRLTTTDPLTGTYNRRQLNKVGEQEMMRARRYHRPVSLIMLDIDFFKGINDQYGHSAGDLALQQTSKTLRKCLRSVDHLGRYGGDEFTIILPETDLLHARLVAERLCAAVAAQVVVSQNRKIQLSISLGVAGVMGDAEEPAFYYDQLTQLADKALYKAKEAGRNCVKVWEEQ